MSLSTKLLLTFALIIAVALGSAGWLINRSAATAYRTYLSGFQQRQLQLIADDAAARYAETNAWASVQAWLDQTDFAVSTMAGMRGAGPMGRGMAQERQDQLSAGTLVVVEPVSGAPLAGGAEPVDAAALAAGVPVVQQGQTVALLVARLPLPTIGPAEEAVLSDLSRTILLSALGAILVAILAGGSLLLGMLRPLRQLEAAVTQVAHGDLAARVAVTSEDEIGQLAQRFNEMAHSLRAQEALRQRLAADIAHELRTPLSVIQGNLQAMLDGVYPLEPAELETVFDETRLLARLVNDLHELTQAEAGRLPLERQPVAIAAVLAAERNAFAQAAGAQQITLQVDDQAPNVQVYADPDRLQQVLHNLLSNALRHTPAQGIIRIGAATMAADMVRFDVADSGSGIAPADLPHVFDRFYRAESSRIRAEPTGGAGLGLAIVKALVEAQAGQVGVESEEGQGATFWFTLPQCATGQNQAEGLAQM
ncbi:MAG: ATP-binding protein [Caldilineaceae bacterium]